MTSDSSERSCNTDTHREASERDIDALVEGLRQTEERLYTLLDNIPYCIFRYDADARHIFVSPAVTRLFGRPAEQFIGRRPSEIGAPGSDVQNAELEDMIRRVFAEGVSHHAEAQWMTADGMRFFELTHVPERDEDGHITSVLSIANDITERKRAEDELRASEARFRSFADHAMDAFFLHGDKGVVLDANRQACLSLGYSRDELIGMSPAQFDADLSPEFRDRFRARVDKGEIVTFESHHRRKDGTTFPVEVRLRPFSSMGERRYISTARDISERYQVEDDLRRLNRELGAISRCHQTLLRASDEKSLLGDICHIICDEAGYRLAWVGYIEHDEAKTIVPMAVAGHDQGYIESIVRSRFTWSEESEHGRGIAGEAIRSGEIAYVADIAIDPRIAPWRERALERGYRSAVGLPLKDEQAAVFGVMLVYSEQVDGINRDDMRLMDELTRDLAFGISVLRSRGERKRAEDSLQLLNRELRAISLCHQTLLRASDEKSLLDDICRIICDEAGYRMAWVGDVEHDEARSIRPVSWAGFDSGYVQDASLSWAEDSPQGQGPSGIAARTGEIIYAQDIATDPRMRPWRESALERGYRSSIAVPLKNKGGEVFGLLTIYASKPHAMTVDEIRLLGELADDLSFGIDVLHMRRERGQAEDALRRGEEKYRTIFANSPLGIFRTTFEGRFIELNPALAHMLGYDSPEEVMREIHDIGRQIYAEGHDRQKVVQRQLSAKDDAARYQCRYRRRDGSEFDVTLYLKTVRDAEGRPVMFDGIVEDITERLQAEDERQQLQEQLLQAQKMESVGRLAGGIAHDFNNMLGAIMGYTELALQSVHPTHRLHIHLQEIMKAADRSAELTRQLLAFARKQPALPTMLDLNATVAGMLMMLRRMIGEDIRLDWLPGDGVWQVRMDPIQIDQILANLCVNARDAIGSIGSITIDTANTSLTKTYCARHPGAVPGDYVMLEVRDDGCGMDEETLDHVFEPFFTTKAVGQGTGLGLAMVYGIVKQNGGFIDIDSRPGQGTRVRIYLPSHLGGRKKVEPDAQAATPMPRGSETILLVEDEAVVLDMAKLMLEECGYRVLMAPTPDEAIRLADAHADEIRLLITDVVMPGMNGNDLATLLSSRYPGIKTLFMSGYPGNAIAQHGVIEQRVHFIQKPFTMEALTAKVREVLDSD